MSRQQSLQRGSALMVLGALIFLAYAVVFFLLALSSSGFEIGVATLNGVTIPMHWMGHFNYDWVSHLGPIYLGTIIYVVGVVVALIGLSQAAPTVATARR